MAAEVIASRLGFELWKIDPAAVVSKYIGETEKNLSKVFASAETGNAILFFDEADALLGKRGEVRDAHDRFANMEVSYLLQRMEEYPGVVILATNLRKNVDDAFLRRLSTVIEFPLPAEAERRTIWDGFGPPACRVTRSSTWISWPGGARLPEGRSVTLPSRPPSLPPPRAARSEWTTSFEQHAGSTAR